MRFDREGRQQFQSCCIHVQHGGNGRLNFPLLGLRRQSQGEIGLPDIEPQKFGCVQLRQVVGHIGGRFRFRRCSPDPDGFFDSQSNTGRILNQHLPDVRRHINDPQRRDGPGFAGFHRHDAFDRNLARSSNA